MQQPYKPISTYETILLYVRTIGTIRNLRRACFTGEIPVSYPQAMRCVRKAEAAGEVTITRQAGEQGCPLVVEAIEL